MTSDSGHELWASRACRRRCKPAPERSHRSPLAQLGEPAPERHVVEPPIRRGLVEVDTSGIMTPVADVERDGVVLAYEERGDGAPPIVLVHGILCDRRYMTPQLEHFSRTHRTVAIDLRGHGESGAPEQAYTIGGFADDVGWMCQELGVERPVVVGHSLGGIVALALAAQHQTPVRGIVALDSVMVPPAGRDEMMRRFFDRLRTEDHVAAVREYFSHFFGPADDPTRDQWILDEIAKVPRHVAVSAWESGFFGFDTAGAAAECDVPFLYIDAGTPNVDLDRLAELCPTLLVGRTVGAGHFHQLEVPDQVNAMIDRYVAVAI